MTGCVDWVYVADLSYDLVEIDCPCLAGAVAHIEAYRHTRDAITSALLEAERLEEATDADVREAIEAHERDE